MTHFFFFTHSKANVHFMNVIQEFCQIVRNEIGSVCSSIIERNRCIPLFPAPWMLLAIRMSHPRGRSFAHVEPGLGNLDLFSIVSEWWHCPDWVIHRLSDALNGERSPWQRMA
jgi:hypothetical protein